MIRRSFDAGDINPILNHPDVLPSIGASEASLDASALIADPRNVLLMAEGGGLIFTWQEPGIYEVHNNFLKASRGRYAMQATLAAIRWMFLHTDCMTILTRVPQFNRGARRAARACGGILEFERQAAWAGRSDPVSVSFWALRYDDWIRRQAGLIESGRAFHQDIDREFARLGNMRASHPDEDCHDLRAGACIEMVRAGQPEKAIILYNRWARFAGYGLVSLLGKNPMFIDVGEAVLQVFEDGTFRAVKCR